MPTIRFSRPFASGSRPTPDPFDKFLDSHGFYRKHTARDSTNLFRVISEQLYDTQDHHKQIRKDCVNFMIKHRDQYESLIQGDFNQYVRGMAKNDTFGTLMELRAAGYLFKRNIKLFRPFDLGVWFVEDPNYEEAALNVFHASHFDSVFEQSYIFDAAFCQSIVYETLYKNVFKLPDIEYSVETMLHSDINHEPSSHEYGNGDEYATHIVFEDGRKFQLDRPENTLCILNDPMRCHFHNKQFEELLTAKHPEKSILSDKFCSCVRQLLFDGITPFPYKVAKALDENIYRNVEFDSWNEERKAAKSKQNHFKVGVECLVQLSEMENDLLKCRIKAKGSNGDEYIVHIENLGEKRSVPFSSLRPLSGTECDIVQPRRRDTYTKLASKKPSIECVSHSAASNKKGPEMTSDLALEHDAICKIQKSLDLESYISLSNFNFTRTNQHEIIAYPLVYSQPNNMSTNNNSGGNSNTSSSKTGKNRNQNSQNQNNVQCDSNEKQQQVLLSKADEDHSYAKNVHESQQDTQQTPNSSIGYYQNQHQEQNIDASVPVSQPQVPNFYPQGGASVAPIYYCPTPEYNDQMYSSEMIVPQGVYTIPAYQTPQMQPNMYAPINGNPAPHYPVQVGTWPGYNPPMNQQGYVFSGQPHYAMSAIPAPVPFHLPFLTRDLLRSNGRINFNPNYAYAPNAEDLPLNDKISMRFYYNLGVEYYKLLQSVHGTGQLMAMIDGDPCAGNSFEQQSNEIDSQQNQMVSDLQQMNFESNDIEIQSPSKHQRNYNEFGYGRRGGNVKYKRNDNRPNVGKNFQGSFSGPTSKPFSKNSQKYMNNQSGNGSYDGTPVKDTNAKIHQHGSSKREQPYTDNDVSCGNNISFGSNVPPFPFYEQNELNQPYVPPGNVFPRMTPPVSRMASIPIQVPTPVPYHQVHGSYWMTNPPPNSHQLQSQQHQQNQQPQSQSHSLNTSGASNPSQ